MQYVLCSFGPGSKNYTYHNDLGKPVKKNDKVIIETKDGEAEVRVVQILKEKPKFQTKPVLKIIQKKKTKKKTTKKKVK